MNTEAQTQAVKPLLVRLYPEASEILGGIGRTSIYKEVAEGRLKTVKIGARTFIALAELERYVEAASA